MKSYRTFLPQSLSILRSIYTVTPRLEKNLTMANSELIHKPQQKKLAEGGLLNIILWEYFDPPTDGQYPVTFPRRRYYATFPEGFEN